VYFNYEWMNEYFIHQHRYSTVKTVKSRTVSTGQKGSKSTYNCPALYKLTSTPKVSQCIQLWLDFVCMIVLSTFLTILRFILCTVFNGCGLSAENEWLIDWLIDYKACCGRPSCSSVSALNTIRAANLTCAQKLTWVTLIYRTEPTTKSCKTDRLKSGKRIRSEVSANMQSGESVESVLEKKRKGTVGRICSKGRF